MCANRVNLWLTMAKWKFYTIILNFVESPFINISY